MDADTLELDPTNRNITSNLSLPYLTLFRAYDALGDDENALRNLRMVYQLTPSAEVRRLLDQAETALLVGDVPEVLPDSTTDGNGSP